MPNLRRELRFFRISQANELITLNPISYQKPRPFPPILDKVRNPERIKRNPEKKVLLMHCPQIPSLRLLTRGTVLPPILTRADTAGPAPAALATRCSKANSNVRLRRSSGSIRTSLVCTLLRTLLHSSLQYCSLETSSNLSQFWANIRARARERVPAEDRSPRGSRAHVADAARLARADVRRVERALSRRDQPTPGHRQLTRGTRLCLLRSGLSLSVVSISAISIKSLRTRTVDQTSAEGKGVLWLGWEVQSFGCSKYLRVCLQSDRTLPRAQVTNLNLINIICSSLHLNHYINGIYLNDFSLISERRARYLARSRRQAVSAMRAPARTRIPTLIIRVQLRIRVRALPRGLQLHSSSSSSTRPQPQTLPHACLRALSSSSGSCRCGTPARRRSSACARRSESCSRRSIAGALPSSSGPPSPYQCPTQAPAPAPAPPPPLPSRRPTCHTCSRSCALFPGARETERERDADPADGRRALVTAAATFIAFIGRLVDRAAQRLTQPPARVVSIAAWRSQLGGLVSSLEQLQCCLVNALLNFLFQCHLSNSGDQTLTQTLSQTGASKQANPGAAQRLPASDSSTFQLTNEFVNSILLLFRTFKSMLIAKSPIIHVCAWFNFTSEYKYLNVDVLICIQVLIFVICYLDVPLGLQ